MAHAHQENTECGPNMRPARKPSTAALTLVEFLIVVAVLAALVMVLLPALTKAHGGSRTNCTNNLKQVGLAFETWELDNNDKSPMQVSVTNGGTMELVGSGNAFMHFVVMSNELSTPKLLFCPAETDRRRVMASTFNQTRQAGSAYQIPFTNDLNVSYFVCVDTNSDDPAQALLSGDRDFSINGVAAQHGLHPISTNDFLAWDPKSGHKGNGNILISDGSVNQLSTSKLNSSLAVTGSTTNRLVFP
jgi:competence protein ComGC